MNYKTYGKLDRAFGRFNLATINQLRDDVVAELTDGSMVMSDSDRAYGAWFMRNYIFLPYTLLAELFEYRDPERCYSAIRNLEAHAVTPASLDGTFIDGGCLKELELLVKTYYTFTQTGIYLDRLDNETAEFMLYQMSKLVGYEDKARGGTAKPYEPTPKELSSRACLCEILSQFEQGIPLDDIDSNFLITKITH